MSELLELAGPLCVSAPAREGNATSRALRLASSELARISLETLEIAAQTLDRFFAVRTPEDWFALQSSYFISSCDAWGGSVARTAELIVRWNGESANVRRAGALIAYSPDQS